MTDVLAVRVPPGPGGDEFVKLLKKLDSRFRISPDIEKLTRFMRSDPNSPEIRSAQGILASEKTRSVQRLAAGRDSSFQLKSIGKEPFGTKDPSSLLGGSATNPSFSPPFQEPRALNAVDILLGTAPGCSSWSSGDSGLDSVVKREDEEDGYPLFTRNPPLHQEIYPLFKDVDVLVKEEVDDDAEFNSGLMEGIVKEEDDEFVNSDGGKGEFGENVAGEEHLNPPLQQEMYPLFKDVDVLVKEEVDDDGEYNSGFMKGLVKQEDVDDSFVDSDDREEEIGENVAAEENQVAPADASAVFLPGHVYQCKLCDARCPTTSLMKHWHSHPLCKYCRKRFRNKEILSAHKLVHTTCDLCERTFPNVRGLKLHMRIHTDERPFACQVCENTFRTAEKLRVHVFLHTGERPYVCEVCQKGFRMKAVLTKHLRIHTEEKPFECVDCQMRFTQKGNLWRHRRRVHGSGEQGTNN